MTMSASFNASALTLAPAAVNSESGRPDLMPAPGSTATSTPNALNFFTVSGEAATRGSDGAISLATAIFIADPSFGRQRKIVQHPTLYCWLQENIDRSPNHERGRWPRF